MGAKTGHVSLPHLCQDIWMPLERHKTLVQFLHILQFLLTLLWRSNWYQSSNLLWNIWINDKNGFIKRIARFLLAPWILWLVSSISLRTIIACYKTEHLVTLLILIFIIIKLNIVHGNHEQLLAINVFLTGFIRRQNSVILEHSLGQAAYNISIALP